MHKFLIGMVAGLLLIVGTNTTSNATPISFTDVSGTGTFFTGFPTEQIGNAGLGLLTDGIFPGEWSYWQSNQTVSFNQWGAGYDREYFTFDMGSLFIVDDINISVDNNDSYTIEYSIDNATWSDLTIADLSYGEVGSGMDTLSSISGNSEYVPELDFAQSGPARYLRIFVDGYQGVGPTSVPDVGDGAYAIGEFQVFGEAYDDGSAAPVPEPGTMLLFGTGLIGLAGIVRRKTK
ncbi:MAG: PEP-CTERM sorting domain-containing protein [Desulfobacterales bacterium]|nr:PEP-CTERM sorting domain-containing protein [Desulfobacterales bacterium]